MTGEVILDVYGDREPDYWITDVAPNGTFVKVAEVLNIGVNNRVCCANSHLLFQVFWYPGESGTAIQVGKTLAYMWTNGSTVFGFL